MKEIKLMLSVIALALVMLTAVGVSQESWNLGSSDDWLGTPVYHNGPFYYPPNYYPDSNLPAGTQQYLNSYPYFTALGYPNYYQNSNYYPNYVPMVLNGTGTYTQPSNYLQGYNNPYFYDPQSQLDLAIANHAYQRSLTNYYNRYYGTYP